MRKFLIIMLFLSQLSMAGSAIGRTLMIGYISDTPGETIKIINPFAEYLANQLGDVGIDSCKVLVVDTIPGMANKMRNQEIDMYIDSPFPVTAVSRLAESTIVLRRWKKGVAEYRSKFVVAMDSPLQSIMDLQGKMIAFEDPASTSGYFLPKAALLTAGLKPKEHNDKTVKVSGDEVGFTFSLHKNNTLLWVARGLVAAGAVGTHELEEFEAKNPKTLRVIHETQSVPRNVVSFRKGLEENLGKRIREVLLAMEKSEQGQSVLKHYEKTVRFDEIPGGVIEAMAPFQQLTADMQ
jgi:phosphonate transport system substrate-binding protein